VARAVRAACAAAGVSQRWAGTGPSGVSMAAQARGGAGWLGAAARALAAGDARPSQRGARPSYHTARPSSRVVAARRAPLAHRRAGGLPCAPSVRLPGMRGRPPRVARGAAVASGARVASAPSARGGGARAQAAPRAAARSWTIGVADVLPAYLGLPRGPPPSWDTRRAHTACGTSGRWAVAELWARRRACSSLAGTSAPRRAKRGAR
jgi:hypothetical protein